MRTSYLDRISITVWAVTMTLAATALLSLPGQGADLLVGDRSLALPVASTSAIPVILALLAGSGTEAVVRAHPLALAGQLRVSVRFWALPIAVTLIAALTLPLAPSVLYWAVGLLGFALFLSAVLAALYFSLDVEGAGYRRARLTLNLTCYAIALVLFLLVPESLSNVARSLTFGGVTLLLALELLRGTGARVRYVTLYAVIVAVIVAEVAAVIPLTGLSTISSGLLLLLLFYLLVGLSWQSLMDRLTRRVALEFGAVALVGLALILAFAP